MYRILSAEEILNEGLCQLGNYFEALPKNSDENSSYWVILSEGDSSLLSTGINSCDKEGNMDKIKLQTFSTLNIHPLI